MYTDSQIWIGSTGEGKRVFVLPQMACRHGMIAGATGTGKTITLKVLAESFSDMGVPVFVADVKGDLAGLCAPGEDSQDMEDRIGKFMPDPEPGVAAHAEADAEAVTANAASAAGFSLHGCPVTFWDIYGKNGIQLRTTISEMGPLLLSRILGLNDLQAGILSAAFQIADKEQLLLIDTKDLKALLNYIVEKKDQIEPDYGKISPASVSVIIRNLAALESEGGDLFFGDPALDIRDLFTTDSNGKGMIHILDSQSLIGNRALYSTFLLWLLSELFETLPEAGDLDKPKMMFFFDEAHLLFHDAPKALLEKIEQVVRLIRSKGVGVFFSTQNPGDIPDTVLSQLGNRIEHGLHAYTPHDQKTVRSAAEAFPVNPAFDTYQTILSLGVGEAVVSLLGPDGVPRMAEKISVLPPQSHMGSIDEETRRKVIRESLLYSKYAVSRDPDSAYEFLKRRVNQEAAERLKAEEEAAAQKQKEKEEAAARKQLEKEEQRQKDSYRRAVRSVGTTAAGTVGRELGKNVGESMFGKFGKTLGGNVGASLGRGILSTLLKK